jgi:hypothetical protein
VQRDELETCLLIRMEMHRGLDHAQMLMLDVGKRIDKSVLLVVVSQRYDAKPLPLDLACPFVVPDITPDCVPDALGSRRVSAFRKYRFVSISSNLVSRLSGSDTPILINSCSDSIRSSLMVCSTVLNNTYPPIH